MIFKECNIACKYYNLVILCGNIPSILAEAVLDNGPFYTCTLCNRRLSDIVMHFVINCEFCASKREQMLDRVQDILDVQHSAILFSHEDEDLYRIILSGNLLCLKDHNQSYFDEFHITTSIGILKLTQAIDRLRYH